MPVRSDRVSWFPRRWLAILLLCFPAMPVQAEALVAVAANFATTARALEALFVESEPHRLSFSVAATGKLYAQIRAGAPFDVLLAADAERPARLEQEGYAVPGSRRTYALGRLGLWVPDAEAPVSADTLKDTRLRHIAIANPRLAPYGLAAQELFAALGLAQAMAGRIVLGQDVGEAFALVASGAADAGLVARAQLLSIPTTESIWWVPADMHSPIRQDLVLLRRGKDNAAARAFVEFLTSPAAQATIRASGYDTPTP
jgi:molybdate transport system substrate-binding protein